MVPTLGTSQSYWFFYLGAIPIHAIVGYFVARRLAVPLRLWALVTASYALGMTIGAKLLFDTIVGSFSIRALFSSSHYLAGGLWGGPFVVLALLVGSALVVSWSTPRALDYAALTLPAPMMVAHLGCFMQGCCYGRPTSLPWEVAFPEGGPVAPGGVTLHPTQLYEIGLLLIVVAVYRRVLREAAWTGTLLGWFLAAYCLGRAFVEVFRGDQRVAFAGVSASQVICVLVAMFSVLALGLVWRHR